MYKDLRITHKLAHQGSEDSLQKLCAEWLKKALAAAGLPQELFWHVPSEGMRKPQYRAKLKLMGFRAGIPDICLALPSDGYHGLFVELKAAGNGPEKEQKKMLLALTKMGYICFVINDFETFKNVLSFYIEQYKQQ